MSNQIIRGVLAAAVLWGVSAPAMADHPALGYWLVSIEQLTKEIDRAGELSKVDVGTLEKMAECHGYFSFKGVCHLRMNAKTVQIGIDAEDDGKAVKYSFQLRRSSSLNQSAGSQGELIVQNDLAVKDGWQQDSYVLVLKRLNLKH